MTNWFLSTAIAAKLILAAMIAAAVVVLTGCQARDSRRSGADLGATMTDAATIVVYGVIGATVIVGVYEAVSYVVKRRRNSTR